MGEAVRRCCFLVLILSHETAGMWACLSSRKRKRSRVPIGRNICEAQRSCCCNQTIIFSLKLVPDLRGWMLGDGMDGIDPGFLSLRPQGLRFSPQNWSPPPRFCDPHACLSSHLRYPNIARVTRRPYWNSIRLHRRHQAVIQLGSLAGAIRISVCLENVGVAE
ncbi:hypothetical protein EJ08DRAFT_665873 [Tothia fuscella]|uniref:Secreted protein n=1 Tax=Tothia fuscella TaxID=1048955 RepID=A0A9P4NG43_9PEZI|nr:hypothetical protein EJ08DRAFT_665873 [Tothia fuscella]